MWKEVRRGVERGEGRVGKERWEELRYQLKRLRDMKTPKVEEEEREV